jgi:hypothetical protein
VDSHAEDNKGRGENESKIGEQLERRTSLATVQDGSGPWGYNGSKRTNTVVNHTCNAVRVQRESRVIRNHFSTHFTIYRLCSVKTSEYRNDSYEGCEATARV